MHRLIIGYYFVDCITKISVISVSSAVVRESGMCSSLGLDVSVCLPHMKAGISATDWACYQFSGAVAGTVSNSEANYPKRIEVVFLSGGAIVISCMNIKQQTTRQLPYCPRKPYLDHDIP